MGYVRRKGREPIRKRVHRLEDRALDLGRRGAADAVPALQVVGDGLQIGRDGRKRYSNGLLYLGGMLVMLWNVVMTIRQGRVVEVPVLAVNPAHA